MEHKLELEALMAMSPEMRKVVLLSEKVEMEQHWLQSMLTEWKDDRSVGLAAIREQRKRVQIWATRLNEAKKRLTESEQNDRQSQSLDSSTV